MGDFEAAKLLEEKIGKKLVEKKELVRSIGVAVAIELSGDAGGRWVIDCASADPVLKKADSSVCATTIKMDTDVFEKIMKKELDPQMAFLTGKVKIEGNLGVAIKLGQLLS